jgi:O6-methylguanine-DNA--protein-cysteine methyltransferase
MNLFRHRLETPLGGMIAATDDAGRLACLMFEDYERSFRSSLDARYDNHVLNDAPTPNRLEAALRQYFLGEKSAVEIGRAHV